MTTCKASSGNGRCRLTGSDTGSLPAPRVKKSRRPQGMPPGQVSEEPQQCGCQGSVDCFLRRGSRQVALWGRP